MLGLFDALARPVLLSLDAEKAHAATIAGLKLAPIPRGGADDKRLAVEVFGLDVDVGQRLRDGEHGPDAGHVLATHGVPEQLAPPGCVGVAHQVGLGGEGAHGVVGEPLDVAVFGDGEQSRCFCHVTDTVEALVQLLDRSDSTAGEIYNVGNTQEVTINQLANCVIEAAGSAGKLDALEDRLRPFGIHEICRSGRIALERGFELHEHSLSLYAACTKPNCVHRAK